MKENLNLSKFGNQFLDILMHPVFPGALAGSKFINACEL